MRYICELFYVFVLELTVVKQSDRHGIGQLGDDLLRVGNSTFLHSLPDAINLVRHYLGNHAANRLPLTDRDDELRMFEDT